MKTRLLTALLALVVAGCGPTTTTPGPGEVEAIQKNLQAVIDADARFAQQTLLTHGDYQGLSDRLAKVAGVAGSTYAGDGQGTINVKIEGGGWLQWRHIAIDLNPTFVPDGFDFGLLNEPTHNAGYSAPELVVGPRSAGTYATHFPVATLNPDPSYAADKAEACPSEGSIAIVDFYYSEVKKTGQLYTKEFDIDGMELWDRLQKMGEAAHFKVDIYKDKEITASNFARVLKGYTYVVLNGHGSMPGPVNTDRLGEALVTINTPEPYDPALTLENGVTYEDAWKRGWLFYGLSDNKVRWTPRLIEATYEPSGDQLWMLNECFSMLPNVAHYVEGEFKEDPSKPLFNFGHALRKKGVKAVFGYVLTGDVWAIAHNTMAFFRRQFGGYFSKDRPPSPHHYWPTCMTVQTFFRLAATPAVASYANKLEGKSLYTMYADPTPLHLRKVCKGTPAIAHALMQDFVLSVGTPATAFQTCWDSWWSQGKDPNPLQDALCSKGEYPTTQENVENAACGVAFARKVTNAMLP